MKTTPRRALAAFATLCLLAAPACDTKKEAAPDAAASKKADAKDAKPDGEADAAKKEEAPADAADAAADGAGTPDAAADGGDAAAAAAGEELPKIGVAQCDDYVEQMRSCFAGDGVPEDKRQAQKDGFEQTVRGWAAAIKGNPEAKSGLEVGCKAALDMAKRSYPRCFE